MHASCPSHYSTTFPSVHLILYCARWLSKPLIILRNKKTNPNHKQNKRGTPCFGTPAWFQNSSYACTAPSDEALREWAPLLKTIKRRGNVAPVTPEERARLIPKSRVLSLFHSWLEFVILFLSRNFQTRRISDKCLPFTHHTALITNSFLIIYWQTKLTGFTTHTHYMFPVL